MRPFIRGVFLTSQNPADTARFYHEVAGLEVSACGNEGQSIYWKVETNGIQLAIHDAEAFAAYSHPSRPESNVTHLYFKIDDQPQFLAHLKTVGITPSALDEVVITIVDPDGRMVMFGTA